MRERNRAKLRHRKIKCLLLTAVIVLLFTACGKEDEGLSKEVVASYEHTFSNVVATGEDTEVEVVIDEQGFYVTDDYIYVKTNQVNVRKEPSSDSELITTVNYGEKLYRTGYNEDGWERIYYEDGEAYVHSNYVTTLTIDNTAEFNYSVAALNIVETSKQSIYYYSYDELCGDLDEIKSKFPEMVQLNAIGSTADNRTIFEIVIGNPEAEHSILLVAGMESCEYMTSMFAAKLSEYYAHYGNEGYYNGYSYAELLEHCSIHIIPMLNPDGVTLSQYYIDSVNDLSIRDNIKSWFERDQGNGGTNLSLDMYLMFSYANARGTDLTINFPYHWEDAESTPEPANTGYKGDSEASENETASIIRLIDTLNPDAVINLRTTGDNISYNFGMSDEVYEKADKYATLMSETFAYTKDDSKYGKSYYGSLEGYAACVKEIPALRIKVGSGDAPLNGSEYNSIWNSGRESMAALMVQIINGV